jgi:phage/plasmid-associated DNA primase
MEQTKQYRTQVDDVQQFINECLVKDETGKVAWSDIVNVYNKYKKSDVKTNSRESTLLKKQLITKLFEKDCETINIEGKPHRGWKGYIIKNETD